MIASSEQKILFLKKENKTAFSKGKRLLMMTNKTNKLFYWNKTQLLRG